MSEPYNPPRPFYPSSRYGWRTNPISGEPKFHAGQDFAAPAGTPIPAALPGKVVYSGFNQGFGNTVIVQTTNGHSLYAHLRDAPSVEIGQQIWPGDVIGSVGNTGEFSRGNHLHYATITSGKLTGDGTGKIGFKIGEQNTEDPATFDAAIRYPNQTLQSGRAMFGPRDTDDALMFGNGRSSLTDASPFHQFGLLPPEGAPDFTDRFGNWTSPPSDGSISAPASVPTQPRGLAGLLLDHIQRLDQRDANAPPGSTSDSGVPAVPFVLEDGEGTFADRFGDRPPVRRLSSRLDGR